MKKHFSSIAFATVLIALYVAIPVFAQDDGGSANMFAGRPTLWLAIIIGFVATAATAVYAYQLRGGAVGSALALIAGGMFLVVLGFLAVVVNWTDSNTQAVVHDILFIIGYLMMIVSALRLRQALR